MPSAKLTQHFFTKNPRSIYNPSRTRRRLRSQFLHRIVFFASPPPCYLSIGGAHAPPPSIWWGGSDHSHWPNSGGALSPFRQMVVVVVRGEGSAANFFTEPSAPQINLIYPNFWFLLLFLSNFDLFRSITNLTLPNPNQQTFRHILLCCQGAYGSVKGL